MKKKVITALLITMTLTLGGVGTAYAMNNDMSILSGEAVNDVNMIKEGFIWVVDKEAWEETIHHEAVVENKWIVDKEAEYETVHHPAVTDDVWVVDKEAWTEEIKHPAVVENKWVEDKPAWVEEIKHPEEGHNEIRNICHNCGADITGHAMEHITNPENISNGCMSYGNKEVWIVDKEAWTEYKEHPAEGHYEDVVVKPAWTETVKHPEQGHYEEVVIKEAWDETVLVSPEEGHYEEVVIKPAWMKLSIIQKKDIGNL